MKRHLTPLAVVLAAAAAAPLGAAPPTTLPPSTSGNQTGNQQLADAVATGLRGSGLIKGADVNIVALDGRVNLQGTVSDPVQARRIEEFVRGVNGVSAVQNGLQAAQPVNFGLGHGGHAGAAAPPAPMVSGPFAGPTDGGLPAGAFPAGPVVGAPGIGGPGGPGFPGGGSDPVPVSGGAFPSYDNFPPPLPNNAWPTYAPYNNFSRVGYPTVYPYQAFPFIGPYYPFPKVPLGWRKVTLEWEDGYWYYGRKSTPMDYWRVRFW